MKIIFLCGSLELGKDGVGDYTRRLAGELIRQDHYCAIVAIMDKGVNSTLEEIQESELAITIPVIRFPYDKGYSVNGKEAKRWIDAFDPEWISLQYVPFSFHPKGLHFGFCVVINKLIKGRKLHVMFHELWVGMNREASFKLQIWGMLQREMISSFIKNLKPLAIHTHTKLYQLQLNKICTSVSLLPLFSNIKVVHSNPKIKNPNHLRFVVFGAIHLGAPIEAFAKEFADYAINKNLKISFTFIGRCGKEQEHWATVLHSFKLEATILGELSAEQISKELSEASIGIVNTPLGLIEKSGANAAMREHGLSVICLSHNWTPRGVRIDYDYQKRYQFESGNITNLINNQEVVAEMSLLRIANSFINTINSL
ncbi:hypothetical protein [Flavobacterium sp. LB1P71]|uniref:hypothetical protein n=1 Tax=unclassified Flavobacterium TaxID=196869 RepID=UPI003AABEC76